MQLCQNFDMSMNDPTVSMIIRFDQVDHRCRDKERTRCVAAILFISVDYLLYC